MAHISPTKRPGLRGLIAGPGWLASAASVRYNIHTCPKRPCGLSHDLQVLCTVVSAHAMGAFSGWVIVLVLDLSSTCLVLSGDFFSGLPHLPWSSLSTPAHFTAPARQHARHVVSPRLFVNRSPALGDSCLPSSPSSASCTSTSPGRSSQSPLPLVVFVSRRCCSFIPTDSACLSRNHSIFAPSGLNTCLSRRLD